MRYLYTFIALLMSAFSCCAQNYSPVQVGSIPYFYNKHSGYVRAMRIDSVTVSGSDIIYHPFRTPRGEYILDTNGGSWLGKKIIQKQDGTFLFDNLWGDDTVTIKSQANLGDSWVFHHVTGATKYTATVISNGTMDVLGTSDSIKKIRITAYDSSNNIVITDSLNGLDLILSKNHGLVQAFDIYCFPYHAHGQVYGYEFHMSAAIDVIGKRSCTFVRVNYAFGGPISQYDKQIGDIYEYSVGNNYSNYSRYNSFYMDTIISINPLRSNGWSAEPYPYGHHTLTYHTNSYSSYYSTEAYPGNTLPEENFQRYLIYYFPDDTTYCRNSAKYVFRTNSIAYGWDEVYLPGIDPIRDTYTYKNGLGMVNFSSDTYEGLWSDRRLIFYKKDGVSCMGPVSSQSLPIKLSSIEAVNNGSKNRVVWVAESEYRGDKYELERSGDGSLFLQLATINARGQAPANYSYIDEVPLNGVNYYRLKSIDDGGLINYSKVVTANVSNEKMSGVKIYPNPVKDILTVIGNHLKNITLTNVHGQVQVDLSTEGDKFEINIADLKPGLYFVAVTSANGEKATSRLVKE